MGPAPITLAAARYRGIAGSERPAFDAREPIECAGAHLTAAWAADLVPLYGYWCRVERWQPRCAACLDEGPPFGLFRCRACGHEHQTYDAADPSAPLCVACATRTSLGHPDFWMVRPSQLTEERFAMPFYVDGKREAGFEVLENWWQDTRTGRIVLPSTPLLARGESTGATLPYGALYEVAHRRMARALARRPRVGWAVTGLFERWTVRSLVGAVLSTMPAGASSAADHGTRPTRTPARRRAGRTARRTTGGRSS